MGLNERRAVERFKADAFPGLKERVDAAAGFDVPLDVDWATLGADGYTDQFAAEATRLYFEPLIAALKTIASDDMGKDALRAGLKQVKVTDSKQRLDASGFTFADGVLTLDHRLLNTHNPAGREKTITKLLSDKL